MAATVRRFYIAIGLILVWAASQASELTPPGPNVATALLSARRFDELDRRYGAIQQQYEDHQIPDEDLRAAFRAFYATDAGLAADYDAWVQHSPKSYVAHLAKGIYYDMVGLEQRGGKFIDETGNQQLRRSKAAFQVADRELTASLALDKKPLLSYLYLIDIRSEVADLPGARKLLDVADSIDADNFVVRENYMGSLQTRWGGSVAKMRGFLSECRSSRLSAVHLKQLEAIVIDDEAWVHRYQEGDVQSAVRDYRKAAELNPEHRCDTCGSLLQAAETLLQARNYPQALEIYSDILRRDPNSVHALDQRGFIELQLKQSKQALQDLERAAQLNDAYAQDMLARMYLRGDLVPADRDKAIELLEKAAAQNYEPAKQLLPVAMNGNVQMLPKPEGPAP
jgi:tetratricopeptide (TPR) repeat protein